MHCPLHNFCFGEKERLGQCRKAGPKVREGGEGVQRRERCTDSYGASWEGENTRGRVFVCVRVLRAHGCGAKASSTQRAGAVCTSIPTPTRARTGTHRDAHRHTRMHACTRARTTRLQSPAPNLSTLSQASRRRSSSSPGPATPPAPLPPSSSAPVPSSGPRLRQRQRAIQGQLGDS